jgi:hypothetical protein
MPYARSSSGAKWGAAAGATIKRPSVQKAIGFKMDAESPTDDAGPVQVMQRADQLFREENAEEAVAVLTAFLAERDNPRVWQKLARAYQILGEEVLTTAILRNVILKHPNPHIKDVIAARIPYAKPLVLDAHKIMYFNIPKCGSSSIKDAIALITSGVLRKETAHFHVTEFERLLAFSTIDNEYEEYVSIGVFRHPADRLRSYWRKNITEAHSLMEEAHRKPIYYGLTTTPTYDEAVRDFARYRQVFADFRHHTDSIVGYVGRKRERVRHRFDVTETDAALRLVAELTGKEIPSIHNMKTSTDVNLGPAFDKDLESERVQSFYKEELALFFDAK